MPIFEHDEKITPKEFERQQRALDAKIHRLAAEDFMKKENGGPGGEPFDGGDHWLDDTAEEPIV